MTVVPGLLVPGLTEQESRRESPPLPVRGHGPNHSSSSGPNCGDCRQPRRCVTAGLTALQWPELKSTPPKASERGPPTSGEQPEDSGHGGGDGGAGADRRENSRSSRSSSSRRDLRIARRGVSESLSSARINSRASGMLARCHTSFTMARICFSVDRPCRPVPAVSPISTQINSWASCMLRRSHTINPILTHCGLVDRIVGESGSGSGLLVDGSGSFWVPSFSSTHLAMRSTATPTPPATMIGIGTTRTKTYRSGAGRVQSRRTPAGGGLPAELVRRGASTTAVQMAGGWRFAADGRPLRLGRRRRGRGRRPVLRPRRRVKGGANTPGRVYGTAVISRRPAGGPSRPRLALVDEGEGSAVWQGRRSERDGDHHQ